MFCPKCGQQQVSGNTKFCSRCGISIGGLTEWVARAEGSGVRKETAPAPFASSRKEIKRGAKVMFLSGVLTPIFFGLSIVVDNPGPLLIPLAIFLVGLSLILYARLFGEETSSARSQQAQPSRLGTVSDGAALPPASNIGINNVAGQTVRTPVSTTELVQPPSVTERTTKLLDID